MKSLGLLNIFCTMWIISRISGYSFNFHENIKFRKIIFQTWNFQISKSADNVHKIMILTFFHVYLGLNPIICKMSKLRWGTSYYSLYFLWLCHFFEKYYIPSGTRSSSRGVLTIRKVLPSKSMGSQLSNAPSTILIAIQNQKISYFAFQK